ncbi:hypothetical protein H310_04215 [Aphanomyces invadans]|uniref:Myb-like domain-containing protein n=1 Tax=Aphanomyces invadans TaxID=157072 RepID=A0A024UFR2_9STRA|nr:hypothetical protein H310_04215 [Aphanomyces invadans]ETW05246.1 hypothetical protein H310_04215 [Aphanomyces invadans]RHY32522.1 hypothetical protein DYB32_002500 [Aphanomyces invadans]|eukprot:XP_008866684.1 hypothetical protein H310_04215 [Aphanomyces invadans]
MDVQPGHGAATMNHDAAAMCRKAFCARDDILLCLAVKEIKPWEAPSGEIMMSWAHIAEKLLHTRGFALRKDGPACKTRFEKILKMITGGESDVLRKSGNDEEFAERERLVWSICQQIDVYQAQDESAESCANFAHENAGSDGRKKRKTNKLLKVAKREQFVETPTAADYAQVSSSPPSKSAPRTATPPAEDLRAFFEYLKKRIDMDDEREEKRRAHEKEMEERRAAAEERRVSLELERDRQQQEFMLRVLDMMKSSR